MKKLSKDEREQIDRLLMATHLFISTAVEAGMRSARPNVDGDRVMNTAAAKASKVMLDQIDVVRAIMGEP